MSGPVLAFVNHKKRRQTHALPPMFRAHIEWLRRYHPWAVDAVASHAAVLVKQMKAGGYAHDPVAPECLEALRALEAKARRQIAKG